MTLQFRSRVDWVVHIPQTFSLAVHHLTALWYNSFYIVELTFQCMRIPSSILAWESWRNTLNVQRWIVYVPFWMEVCILLEYSQPYKKESDRWFHIKKTIGLQKCVLTDNGWVSSLGYQLEPYTQNDTFAPFDLLPNTRRDQSICYVWLVCAVPSAITQST